MSPVLLLALFLLAVLSGATASLAGFGIGSLLTPFLALRFGTADAIALVAIPHAAATALRFVRLRHAVDRQVLVRFGALSALGGLAGALLYSGLGNRALTLILAGLLLLTAAAGLSGWTERWHARGAAPWLLGVVSGFFGGIAGNQGGVRAAALLAFRLTPAAFVATATAVALAVDAVRTPIYLWRAAEVVARYWLPVAVAVPGVLLGTLLGERVLLGIPAKRFRPVISSVIGVIGLLMLAMSLAR
jgi:uncharacterized membrane protein YfcA